MTSALVLLLVLVVLVILLMETLVHDVYREIANTVNGNIGALRLHCSTLIQYICCYMWRCSYNSTTSNKQDIVVVQTDDAIVSGAHV